MQAPDTPSAIMDEPATAVDGGGTAPRPVPDGRHSRRPHG